MRTITGQKDPVIRIIRELLTDDGRQREGRFLVEGEQIVRRAFDYGACVWVLVLTERFAASPGSEPLRERARSARVEVHTATEGLIAKTLGAKPTPECLAIVERNVIDLAECLGGPCPLVVMVEHGENADNLGMLLRSADAAGASGVILTADTTDPFARRVVRGSRGGVFTVPLCIHRDVGPAIEAAKEAGVRVVATSAAGETPYDDIDYTCPSMIVVGNEHVGISDEARAAADEVVRIPMLGRIDSLNIAVAASVVLYEAVRQRKGRDQVG